MLRPSIGAAEATREEIAMDAGTVYQNLRAISADLAAERRERQQRRELVGVDFARLRDAGFLLTGVPVDHGGIFGKASARPICEMLRTLAHGNSSVALVCAMHPAVPNSWMATGEAPAPFDKAADEQRRSIFRNVCAGAWWGTIASEPGTAGDIARTRATARRGPSDGANLLTGQKNFGSGSGITSYMITVAVPEGEADPTCLSWICGTCRGTARRE
jgi:alkylation response protein AidB-like acyl-CoA dehydrogenase